MRYLLLIGAVFLAGCDAGMKEEVDDPALNEQLEALITLDGQRRLENFQLPDSDDFARIPQDPRNPLTTEKVLLGKLLFHDAALSQDARLESSRGTWSCATCHHAQAGYQAGRQQSMGDGGSGWGVNGEGRRPDPRYPLRDVDTPPLRSPSALNGAYQRVLMWSGGAGANGPNEGTDSFWNTENVTRANHFGYDGLETQAILALDNHRMGNTERSLVASHPTYQALWDQVFPDQPVSDELTGLAIGAFERTLLANKAPFQRWLRGETAAMTSQEKRGALGFFGPSACSDCHTGPALSSMAFYSLGMNDMAGPDVFNQPGEQLGRGEFLRTGEADFAFKVPQLYNLIDSPFMGHGGTFTSVRDVVEYYRIGIPEKNLPPGTVTDQFHALDLTPSEVDDLVAFLENALRDPDLDRYVPESVPSGSCIPANDLQARADLGCS